MELLMRVLGRYTVNYVVNCREFIIYFACVVILSWYKNKRRRYPARLIGCFFAGLLMCFPICAVRTALDNLGGRILAGSLMSLMFLPILIFLYRESFTEYALCWTGIVVAKGISGNVFALLLNACGIDDLVSDSFFAGSPPALNWFISFSINVAIQVLIYFFLRKQEKNSNALPGRNSAILLACTAFFLVNILYAVMRNYQSGNFALAVCCKVLFVIIYIFILMVRTGLFSHGVTAARLAATEELLAAERRHYAEVKDNVDVINMKCHDIRRQLSSLQGKLTDAELDALRNAIEIYDSDIKTGSDILDLVLYQKKLYCDKHGIKLDFIADGKILGFISSSDLYALLANAIENATEATEALEPDKRLISLNVRKDGAAAVIETVNYFDPNRLGGERQTTKPDKRRHGYGIMSMRHIAELYGGTLDAEIDGDIFFLKISVPIKGDSSLRSE